MKTIFTFLLLTGLLIACNDKKNAPDVSAIKADVAVKRFDKDFFSLDTIGIEKSLSKLGTQYPPFYLSFYKI
ncbi:MAG: hypothetical protein WDN26_21685 [Chitinophagaceae bacterium]